ncbi:MAG TPA: hypothetical protein VEF90_00985 [Xanthobacteraceae bacterium]|nr:hypothetical protein [Xanthobacteraceae bacterium]
MRLWITLVLVSLATPVCAQTTVGSTSGATSSVNISDPPAADPTNHLITTPTIAAPGLAAAGVETCLGSASGGLSLMGGGFTFGATKVDQGCTIRLLARQLFAFGFHKAALALMCQDERVAVAMAVAGSPCPTQPAEPDASLSLLPANESSTAVGEASAPAPMPVVQGGYILDLPPAHKSNPVHVSLMTPRNSPDEQAWFDRASNIN